MDVKVKGKITTVSIDRLKSDDIMSENESISEKRREKGGNYPKIRKTGEKNTIEKGVMWPPVHYNKRDHVGWYHELRGDK